MIKLEPQPEYKCKNCNKEPGKHQAYSTRCPSGGSFGLTKYEPSDKQTIKSKRAIAEYDEKLARQIARIAEESRQRSIIRAMTFEEVVTALVELLTIKTGLGIVVERGGDSCNVHLTTLGGQIRLGYTTVTTYSNGSYGVAGTSAGCFMANGTDLDISNVLHGDFIALEEAANKEKS